MSFPTSFCIFVLFLCFRLSRRNQAIDSCFVKNVVVRLMATVHSFIYLSFQSLFQPDFGMLKTVRTGNLDMDKEEVPMIFGFPKFFRGRFKD